MSDLVVAIDQHFPLSFEGFLFNEPDQVRSQACTSHTFHLTDSKTSFARFMLFIDKQEGKSPYRAPFGSFEFDESLPNENLIIFIKAVEAFCRQNNLNSLSIVSYPYCYSPANSQMLRVALEEQGFMVTIADLNFHIAVADQDFELIVHESERRRLKKSLKENFQMNAELSPNVNEMFAMIKHNRENKGYPLSLKLEELKNLFENHKGKYIAFTLRDDEKLIASAIGVRVNSNILYYFLPADDPLYKNFSPIVAIIKGMYDYCKINNYKILDFGIATDKGERNEGLIKFKEHLGAEQSLKLSFRKEFI